MITQERAGQFTFQPRARLLKLIGEELISDEVVAIVELVKNAHDADASTVVIRFQDLSGPDASIIVTDDGCGMDHTTLMSRWMAPASSMKADPVRRRTPRGRRVLGEKGVGRFAADKLASRLELVSRCAEDPVEVRALLDWDRFDTAEVKLADVKSRWEIREAVEIAGHGTLLRMSGLRTRWTERMFKRLSTRLGRLRSPLRGNDDFVIRIESDQFPEYSGEVRRDFLDQSPYRVDATFDGEQTIEIRVNDRAPVSHPWPGPGALCCGPVRVRLHGFDLETDAVARIGPRMEVRAWLREWSGISIYRDGFRVWPYGEPHDDWLRLDQRRVNNPVERLSNNQVVGFVEIGRDRNPELRDQTNREGLYHNEAFGDLRRLMYFVLENLEAERQAIRRPPARRNPGTPRMIIGEGVLQDDLEEIAKKVQPRIAADVRRVAARLRDQEVLTGNIIEGCTGLAAMGHVASSVGSAVQQILERLDEDIRALGRSAGKKREQVRSMAESLDAVRDQMAMLSAVEGSTDRRRRAIDISVELERFRTTVTPILAARNIGAEVQAPDAGVLRVEMRPEVLGRVLHILTQNSIEWLRGVAWPKIKVVACVKEGRCEITFSDNGRGIAPQLAARVFDPLFSTKQDGRGMGLMIAKNIVQQHGGTIDVLTDGRRRGANIRVVLPRKRTRATVDAV